MRPIKFRAWDKTSRVMTSNEDANFIFYDNRLAELHYLDKQKLAGDDYICMQFTGLLDKNGKEIYEGDILRLDSWNKPQQVSFIEGAFCLADKEGEFTGTFITYITLKFLKRQSSATSIRTGNY